MNSFRHRRRYSLWVVHSFVTTFPRYGTTTVSSSLHKPPLRPMPKATCRLLKYYNKFASRIYSLVPSHTLRGSYLSCPASSCYLLRPSPLNSVFIVGQSLLARWLHVRCFLNLPLRLPTQCSLLPWNVAKSSETSCSVVTGRAEACRLVALLLRVVGSQPCSHPTRCRLSSYL